MTIGSASAQSVLLTPALRLSNNSYLLKMGVNEQGSAKNVGSG